MFKQTRSYTEILTKKIATDFYNMQPTVCERPLKQARVEFLNNRYENGFFYSPEWAKAWLRGNCFRINGQHSSYMLSNLEVFPRGMTVHIREFECDTEQDLADLFAQFDAKVSSRTAEDLQNAQASVIPELSHVSKNCITWALRGIAIAKQKVQGLQNIGVEERSRMLTTEKDFVVWMHNLMFNIDVKKDQTRTDITRGAVIASLYITYRSNSVASYDFWSMVIKQNHPDSNHPTRVLARYIDNPNMKHRKNQMKKDVEILSSCIHAWNAFRNNSNTALRIYAGEIPKVLR